jgi:hypothetical protein
VDNYPDQGKWIIARADYIPHNAQNYNLYVSVENAFAQIAVTAGGVLPGPPFRNPGEAFVLTDITNASAFASAFTNRAVRNFYWDGHGGPDGIGDFPAPDGEMSGFPSATIAFLIGNTTPSTNSTRYRWVWIDSCESALGNWPETFGMGNRENVPLANYVSRPATFCGFTHKVYGYTAFQGGTSSIDIDSINYRSYFQLFWEILGEPVIDSFDDAEFYSGDYYTAQFLKVYGYWGLHLNEYNTKPEWP